VDLRVVRAATCPELAAWAIAAARNAHGLLDDAQVLANAEGTARAYSLAALSVEACGKAYGLTALAMLPRRLRARAPSGRMLEWHQFKQVGGLLLASLPLGAIAPTLVAIPAAEVAQILSRLEQPADEADRLKRRGFYVDMDRAGEIHEPSEITDTELAGELARARQAAASVSVLLSADAQTRIANPPAEARELARAMVEALTETEYPRTPEAAAEVIIKAVSKLRQRFAAVHLEEPPDPSGNATSGLPREVISGYGLSQASRRHRASGPGSTSAAPRRGVQVPLGETMAVDDPRSVEA
jgi:AbiV family abortive infection protein